MGGLSEGDPAGLAELAAFQEELKALGWAPGRDVTIDVRWPGADLERVRQLAISIAGSRPHLVLSRSTPATVALRNEAPSLPTVFVLLAEPVESGIVQSLARPGGSVTGFSNFEGSIGAKWLELLKELSPSLTRVAVLHNPRTAPFAPVFMRSVEAGAQALGVEVVPAPVFDDIGVESAIAAIGRTSGGGLIGITDTFVNERRQLIIELAARLSRAGGLCQPQLHAGWRLARVRCRLSGPVPACGFLRRSYSKGDQSRRAPGSTADALRALNQHGDSAGSRAGSSAFPPGPCR